MNGRLRLTTPRLVSNLDSAQRKALTEAARYLRRGVGPLWSRCLKRHDSGLNSRLHVELTRDLRLRVSCISTTGLIVEAPVGIAIQLLDKDECGGDLALRDRTL